MGFNESFWTNKYRTGQTGWDAGGITTPLKEYFDQLKDRGLRILIPGCGNAYEAEYLYEKGFHNVFLLDISPEPLRRFSERCPAFPEKQLIRDDFFNHDGEYDRVIEQTFFSAIHPSERVAYAAKVHSLLVRGGKLCGVLFDDPLNEDHPPYGGSKNEYIPIFKPLFEFEYFERCNNSIPPRMGRELFILLRKN